MRATKEYRLAMTEEAQKIVDELTLEQKVWLMSGNIDITKMTQEQLVEMMGGTISLESEWQVGTTFTLCIPFEIDTAWEEATVGETSAAG